MRIVDTPAASLLGIVGEIDWDQHLLGMLMRHWLWIGVLLPSVILDYTQGMRQIAFLYSNTHAGRNYWLNQIYIMDVNLYSL